MAVVLTKQAQLDMLSELTGTAGLLGTVSMGLFTSNGAFTQNSTLSGLPAPTYTAYVAQSVVWSGAPYIGAAGSAERVAAPLQFVSSGVGSTEVAYGYVLLHGGALVGGGLLPSPVDLTQAGSAVAVVPRYPLDPASV